MSESRCLREQERSLTLEVAGQSQDQRNPALIGFIIHVPPCRDENDSFRSISSWSVKDGIYVFTMVVLTPGLVFILLSRNL